MIHQRHRRTFAATVGLARGLTDMRWFRIRRSVLVTAVASLLMLGAFHLFWRLRDPIVDGKRLSGWLEEITILERWEAHPGSTPAIGGSRTEVLKLPGDFTNSAAFVAIMAAGPKAAPTLKRILREPLPVNSKLSEWLGQQWRSLRSGKASTRARPSELERIGQIVQQKEIAAILLLALLPQKGGGFGTVIQEFCRDPQVRLAFA